MIKLKVCGMRLTENIAKVSHLKPDFMGFIFYEKSTRLFLENEIPLLAPTIKKVGVFVNASIDEVVHTTKSHKLDMVQLHGQESPSYCKKLRNDNKDIGIIKAFSLNNNFDFSQLSLFELGCDYFLFDTKGPLPGGNGFTFDWNVLRNYALKKPFFLSGGIGLEQLQPLREFLESPISKYCEVIDVNSQFELAPGFKDVNALQKFATAIRNYEQKFINPDENNRI